MTDCPTCGQVDERHQQMAVERIGTCYIDPDTGEHVMPADFPGEPELRWRPDTTSTEDAAVRDDYRCEEATQVCESQIGAGDPHTVIGRHFASGAYRDTAEGKNDYSGFLSPFVVLAFGNYMTKHRLQSDGSLRDSDNWQAGMSTDTYMESMWRHFLDVWALYRGHFVYKDRSGGGERTHILTHQLDSLPDDWEQLTIDEALGGLTFNVQGLWHELLKER